MRIIKGVLALTGLAAALAVVAPAEANPIAMCFPTGKATITAQTVELGFEMAVAGPGEPYEIYRGPKGSEVGPGKPGSVKVDIAGTEPSSGDMGSGVQSTTIYQVEEHCVPIGSWDYRIVEGSMGDLCGGVDATVTTEDPSCAADREADAGGGCALHGGGAAGGSILAALLALGLCRRRRSC